MSTSNYLITKKLSASASSTVYTARHIYSGQDYVLKFISTSMSTDKMEYLSSGQHEMVVTSAFDDIHIVTLIESFYCRSTRKFVLVFEKLDCDLYSFVKNNDLSECSILRAFHHILHGVNYIHQRGYVHFDVKPQNILVDKRNDIFKVSDFGLTRKLTTCGVMNEYYLVTRFYRPPELCIDACLRGTNTSKIYHDRIDSWSLGCLLYFMVSKHDLFPAPNSAETFAQQCRLFNVDVFNFKRRYDRQKKLFEYPKFALSETRVISSLNCHALIKDLLIDLLQFNPIRRITPSTALRHNAFSLYPGITL